MFKLTYRKIRTCFSSKCCLKYVVKIWKENIENCSSFRACRFEKTCFEKNAFKDLVSSERILEKWSPEKILTDIFPGTIFPGDDFSGDHFFRFYYAEMCRKLWPKAPAGEGALGQMSKKFPVYFIHINFFLKPNKQIYSRAKKLYCVAIIFVFWFFIVYLPKKNGNWKMAQGCRLPYIRRILFFIVRFY